MARGNDDSEMGEVMSNWDDNWRDTEELCIELEAIADRQARAGNYSNASTILDAVQCIRDLDTYGDADTLRVAASMLAENAHVHPTMRNAFIVKDEK